MSNDEPVHREGLKTKPRFIVFGKDSLNQGPEAQIITKNESSGHFHISTRSRFLPKTHYAGQQLFERVFMEVTA